LSADESQEQGAAPEAKAGAFTKDKKFGNRLDLTMAIGEPFLLLGAIPDEPVETKFGMSDSAKLLVQKINAETGAPQGAPLRVVTVASAIVEKVLALTPEELAAGPVVQLQHVHSKARDTGALVLSWMRNLTDEDDFSEFGLDANTVSQRTDLARPAGERIPY
jgi:hypothetical protein